MSAAEPITERTTRPRKRGAARRLEDDNSEIVDVPGYGPMTARQKRFCEAYAGHGNGTRAAREAGFSGNADDIGSQASRLLRNEKVAWYLSHLRRDSAIDRGEIIASLRRESLTSDQAGARVRALELLGKSVGMFPREADVTLLARIPDRELAAAVAGDDHELRDAIMRRLNGED